MSSVDPEKGQLGLSLLSPDQREVERRMSKKGASVSTDDNQKRRPGAGSLAAALKAAGLTKLGSVPASRESHLSDFLPLRPPHIDSIVVAG